MNKYLFFQLLTIATLLLIFSSCKKDPVPGCTDMTASNFNMEATEDNGTCVFPGCTDPLAINFNSSANEDDGGCITFVETWNMKSYISDGVDFIDERVMKNAEMKFDPDGDVTWTFEFFNENVGAFIAQRSDGEWELDIEDEELKITWKSSSDFTFCGNFDEELDFDFDGQDELELSTNSCNGRVLTIELEK